MNDECSLRLKNLVDFSRDRTGDLSHAVEAPTQPEILFPDQRLESWAKAGILDAFWRTRFYQN